MNSNIGFNYDDYYYEYDYMLVARNVSARHNLDENTERILLFCFSEIYKKYGKLIPLTSDEIEDLKQYAKQYHLNYCDEKFIYYVKRDIENTNNVEIVVNSDDEIMKKDIAEEYLSIITCLFKDYQHCNFDYPYYRNIGCIDLKEIINKYPNLSMKTIRNVVMYSKNTSIRDELLSDLNNRSFEYQENVCKLIYPISMEMISMFGAMATHDRFYGFKYDLAEENHDFDRKDLYDMYEREIYPKKLLKKVRKKYNLYFMIEFEYLFQTLYISNMSKIDDDKLSGLLKLKEYTINNIPNVSRSTRDVPVYGIARESITGRDIKDLGAGWYCSFPDTGERKIIKCIGCEKIISKSFHEADVLELEKMFLEIVPMILNKNIDYEKIINYILNKRLSNFIDYIFNNVLDRECLVNIQSIMKNMILNDISLKDLIDIYRTKTMNELKKEKKYSDNRNKTFEINQIRTESEPSQKVREKLKRF